MFYKKNKMFVSYFDLLTLNMTVMLTSSDAILKNKTMAITSGQSFLLIIENNCFAVISKKMAAILDAILDCQVGTMCLQNSPPLSNTTGTDNQFGI